MRPVHPPPSTRPRAHRSGGSRGFTLVELLITISIAAILAVLAMPSFKDFIIAQKIKFGASDLHMALIKARSEAIKRNDNVAVVPNSGGWQNGWQIVVTSTAAILDNHSALGPLTVAGPATVTYMASGRVLGGATFNFSSTQSTTAIPRCVTVDLSGRPFSKASAC